MASAATAAVLASRRTASHLSRAQLRRESLALVTGWPSPIAAPQHLQSFHTASPLAGGSAPSVPFYWSCPLARTDLSCLLRRPYSVSTPASSTRQKSKEKSAASSGSVIGASGREYAGWWVNFVKAFAGWMGYTSKTSAAIRAGSYAYDRCAAQATLESDFLHRECGLPKSYQTWFTATNLYLWLLSTRLRALPDPLGRLYLQEVTTQAFVDFETRLRGPPYKVTKSTLVKRSMNDLLAQHRGFGVAMDYAIARAGSQDDDGTERLGHEDAELAAALWRNVFGAQWGGGVGGVEGIFAHPSEPSHVPESEGLMRSVAQSGDEVYEGAGVEKDPDAAFAERLERLVIFVRKEVKRLGDLSDEAVIRGDPEVTNFGRI